MILKAFKEKSNQKFIDTILSNPRSSINTGKINSVGVLLNGSEFSDYSKIEAFLNAKIGITSNKCSFITFSGDSESVSNQWDTIYTSKDFGWKGHLKNQSLIDFTETRFDVLICYFLAHHNELKQIAAMSQANFKIGISNEDERLYDLIIDVNPKDLNIFESELKKYLTILNRI